MIRNKILRGCFVCQVSVLLISFLVPSLGLSQEPAPKPQFKIGIIDINRTI